MKPNEVIEECQAFLAKKLGPEILLLNINLFNRQYNQPLAYTTQNEIFVSRDMAKSSKDLATAILHEIFHHVVYDPYETYTFSHNLVNIAEDYKINQYLDQLFGCNTKKLGLLRNSKFDNLTIKEIAKRCNEGKGESIKPCNCQGVTNPRIQQIVSIIQKKYNINVQRPLFFIDPDSKKEYQEVYPIAHKKLQRWYELRGVNTSTLIEGLWSYFFLKRPLHSLENTTVLNPTQQLVYSVTAKEARLSTIGEAYRSMLMTVCFLKLADSDHSRIINTINNISKRLKKLEAELDFRRKNLKRRNFKHYTLKKLKLKILESKESVDFWKSKNPLSYHLLHDPINVNFKPLPKKAPSLSIKADMDVGEESSVVIPRLVSNVTSRRIKQISNRAASHFETVLEIEDTLTALGMPLIEEEPKERNPEEKPKPKEPKSEKPEDKKKPIDEGERESETLEGSEESEPSEDGEVSETDTSDDGEDLGENEEDTVGQEEGYGEEKEDENSPSNEYLTDPKLEFGNGEGKEFEALLNIEEKVDTLQSILKFMAEIESLLSKKHSRKAQDTPNLPTMFSYGNDLENVLPSELVALARPAFKLKFLADYANHSLLQLEPPQQKRGAMIICIDTSGSMMGERLEMALGFSLAMIKTLNKDKQGIAILPFSHNVYDELVIDKSKVCSINQVLGLLSKIKSGGTDFDFPFLHAYDLKKRMKWKEITVLFITDGQCYIRNPDAISRLKTNKDKHIIVLTPKCDISSDTSIMFDEVHQVGKKEMIYTLAKIGNSFI